MRLATRDLESGHEADKLLEALCDTQTFSPLEGFYHKPRNHLEVARIGGRDRQYAPLRDDSGACGKIPLAGRMSVYRKELPRVYELRDLIQDPVSPDAYFRDFD